VRISLVVWRCHVYVCSCKGSRASCSYDIVCGGRAGACIHSK